MRHLCYYMAEKPGEFKSRPKDRVCGHVACFAVTPVMRGKKKPRFACVDHFQKLIGEMLYPPVCSPDERTTKVTVEFLLKDE